MKPWVELGRAAVPGGDTLILRQRDQEYSLSIRGQELMNSRAHGSEEALATLGLEGFEKTPKVRVLIGGLGMGFTARAALGRIGRDGKIDIGEMIPEVVEWNRGPLAHLAKRPLDDRRVTVCLGDVRKQLGPPARYHAILLDVDNGPGAFSAPGNYALYGPAGLAEIQAALVPGGVLAVWSVDDDRAFTARLEGCGFHVKRHFTPSRPGAGTHHVIWVARTPKRPRPTAPGPAERPSRDTRRPERPAGGPSGTASGTAAGRPPRRPRRR